MRNRAPRGVRIAVASISRIHLRGALPMNQDVVSGPNLVYYVLLVALLSGIALMMWQVKKVRRVPVRARLRRNRAATVHRYDR